MSSSKFWGIPEVLPTGSERAAPPSEISITVHWIGACSSETISAAMRHVVRGCFRLGKAGMYQ